MEKSINYEVVDDLYTEYIHGLSDADVIDMKYRIELYSSRLNSVLKEIGILGKVLIFLFASLLMYLLFGNFNTFLFLLIFPVIALFRFKYLMGRKWVYNSVVRGIKYDLQQYEKFKLGDRSRCILGI